jgi:hypothetical protein
MDFRLGQQWPTRYRKLLWEFKVRVSDTDDEGMEP